MGLDLNGNKLFSTSIGPKGEVIRQIPTDGLVLHLDAGNKNSYGGSGTTWTDLTGNGNNGTLVNGTYFSTDFGGVMNFDGINDYIDISSPNMISTNYTVFGAARYTTIDAPIYPTGTDAGRLISAKSNNWLLGHWGGYTGNYFAEGWVSGVAAGTSDTNWKLLAGTGNISSDAYEIYVNGSSTFSNSNGSQGPNGFRLGSSGGTGEFANGQIGILLVYNRVLARSEIIQIYNITRGRFGL
jgi:hypothetical protein